MGYLIQKIFSKQHYIFFFILYQKFLIADIFFFARKKFKRMNKQTYYKGWLGFEILSQNKKKNLRTDFDPIVTFIPDI